MCVEVKSMLPDNMDVRHSDSNIQNDALDNLEIIEHSKNISKSNTARTTYHTFKCCICSTGFKLTGDQLSDKKDKKRITCSRPCTLLKIQKKAVATT